MNQSVAQKLKAWRLEIGRRENIELYRILQNKTIEDLANFLPKNKEELLAIKGIGEKKAEKYGPAILAIIGNCTVDNRSAAPGDMIEPAGISPEKENVYSVSGFLNFVNVALCDIRIKMRGEVSSVSFKGHLYYSLKDKADGSVVNCFMWSQDYALCGVDIQEGMELMIHGYPEIYKPTGRFTFRTSAIELVGEGALKKAYEELKGKLQAEGLFDDARKKPIPEYVHRIGLITSRDGAVINDFLNNIGRFGYQITFVDSRVEGIMAVKDLIGAVGYFQNKPVDLIVIIRGGGSLESLQAFNNEALIREMVKLPIPVICGIGHDKDVPLLSYAADRAVSTPSIVAREINKSWERAVDRLNLYETNIVNDYAVILKDARYRLDEISTQMRDFYQGIFKTVEKHEQAVKDLFLTVGFSIKQEKERLARLYEILHYHFKFQIVQTEEKLAHYRRELYGKNLLTNISYSLKHRREKLDNFGQSLRAQFKDSLTLLVNKLESLEKELTNNDPERQLKLGYSIITVNGKILKSVTQLKKGDELQSKLSDGIIYSKTEEIVNN